MESLKKQIIYIYSRVVKSSIELLDIPSRKKLLEVKYTFKYDTKTNDDGVMFINIDYVYDVEVSVDGIR